MRRTTAGSSPRQNLGLQNNEPRMPVSNDTIYPWASITKTFTGIAIMQLRDRGLPSLDHPVVKYVPELRLAHNPFGDISQVNIHHLMAHSAGFRAGTWSRRQRTGRGAARGRWTPPSGN